MSVHPPHYVLFSQVHSHEEVPRWRVVLKSDDGQPAFEASDSEPEVRGERLELLAVVRGLEALETPARVTLVTTSRYVQRGLANGLAEWRTNGWSWEWFGQMVPVKNADLWQRLDRALTFHQLECRRWRVDAAHRPAETASPAKLPVRPAPVKKTRGSESRENLEGGSRTTSATTTTLAASTGMAAQVARSWRAVTNLLQNLGDSFRERVDGLAR